MNALAHGAYLRHAIPPAGPAGTLCGTLAEDRRAPNPRQAVHRTTAAPPVTVYAVGDAPPADLFARHTARRTAAERRDRWRDRIHGAALALAFAAILAGAYVIAPLTAGPIRPHVASIEAPR